jgi:hypothetical protein
LVSVKEEEGVHAEIDKEVEAHIELGQIKGNIIDLVVVEDIVSHEEVVEY